MTPPSGLFCEPWKVSLPDKIFFVVFSGYWKGGITISTSTAYISVKKKGLKFSFDGVTSISHALTLKVSTDSDSSEGSDYVNNARNEPDVITLSVVASDTNVAVSGWSKQTLTSLAQIKEQRLLCKVVTPLRNYKNMLLTSLTVQQDDTCPDGWIGTLTFTHTDPPATETRTDDLSSTPTSTGSAPTQSVGGQGGSVLQTILREAGISL